MFNCDVYIVKTPTKKTFTTQHIITVWTQLMSGPLINTYVYDLGPKYSINKQHSNAFFLAFADSSTKLNL